MHVKIWLAILLLAILATPMLASEEKMRVIAAHELGLMRKAIGQKDTNDIIRSTNSIYESLFIQTGVLEGLRSKTTSKATREEAGSNLGSAFYHFTTAINNYLLALITLAYLFLARLIMVLQWLPFLAPFLAAAVVDGMVKHKILHASVAVSNPVKFKIASHLLLLVIVTPILYLFAPFAVTPYFMLAWAIVAAFPIMAIIAGMSPLSYH